MRPLKQVLVRGAVAELGFDMAMDLELLGGGEAAAEVLSELQKAHGLSPADRAKVGLLVGDRVHLERLSSQPLAADFRPLRSARVPCSGSDPDSDSDSEVECVGHHLLSCFGVLAVRSEAQSQGILSGPLRTGVGPRMWGCMGATRVHRWQFHKC